MTLFHLCYISPLTAREKYVTETVLRSRLFTFCQNTRWQVFFAVMRGFKLWLFVCIFILLIVTPFWGFYIDVRQGNKGFSLNFACSLVNLIDTICLNCCDFHVFWFFKGNGSVLIFLTSSTFEESLEKIPKWENQVHGLPASNLKALYMASKVTSLLLRMHLPCI